MTRKFGKLNGSELFRRRTRSLVVLLSHSRGQSSTASHKGASKAVDVRRLPGHPVLEQLSPTLSPAESCFQRRAHVHASRVGCGDAQDACDVR